MPNILRQPVSLEELRAIFRAHPPIALLPPEGDALWRAAAGKPALRASLAGLRRLALAEAEGPLPELTDALYADFSRTGVRLNFERPYFERRRRLARAAIATLVEADPALQEVFRQSLHRKAQDIFAETSWALPAHVTDPSGKDALNTDLFAAETANQFAELLTLFPDSWPEGFTRNVRRRLRTEFFENYLAANPWWLTTTNNWCAVCHQGVLGAALALESDADLLAGMFARAAAHLPNFLRGYTADGATAEGPGYWSYGFGWFAELNAQIEKRTDGELSIFSDDALIPKIARFGPAMVLRGGKLVNFSDSPPLGGIRPSLLEYLAQRLGDASLRVAAANFWDQLAHDTDNLQGERGDLFLWVRLLLRCPDGPVTPTPLPPQDLYLPAVAWLVTRSLDERGHVWEFAAKGGHNAEHHNHNDVGSYLLNIDGERVALEIGAPEYVKDFFRNETRYSFLAARSTGHSVPLVNGAEQPMGEQFRGEIIEARSDPAEAVFALDFTRAYPPEAGLLRGVRRMSLDKRGGSLQVTDTFELASESPLETAIIAPDGVQMESGTAVIRAGLLPVRVVPQAGTMLQELQKHHYHQHDGATATVTRIVLIPREPAKNIVLGYTLELAR